MSPPRFSLYSVCFCHAEPTLHSWNKSSPLVTLGYFSKLVIAESILYYHNRMSESQAAYI